MESSSSLGGGSHAGRAVSQKDFAEAIRRRALEIYQRSGRVAGHDLENWVQAENQIRDEIDAGLGRRTAVVVNVNGVQYVGEYSPSSARGYAPGEFAAGDDITVRFEGEKMYVKRGNGTELETTVVRKIGSVS
jgi:hypothetical protein